MPGSIITASADLIPTEAGFKIFGYSVFFARTVVIAERSTFNFTLSLT